MQVLVNTFICTIRTAFGYELDDLVDMKNKTFDIIEKEINEKFEKWIEPKIYESINKMDKKGWETLIRGLDNIYYQIAKILERLSMKLSVDQFDIIFEIQDDIDYIRKFYPFYENYIFLNNEILEKKELLQIINMKYSVSKIVKNILKNVKKLYLNLEVK